MTNADRIRAMTDKELAKFMNVHDCPPKGSICSRPYDMARCDNCWLDWLKQEVEE